MGKLQNNTKIRKWKIIVVNAQGKQDNANPQTDARDYARLPCLGYIQEAKPMLTSTKNSPRSPRRPSEALCIAREDQRLEKSKN